MNSSQIPILEMRVAVTTVDFERMMKFYSDALGQDPAADWSTDHAKAVMFEMGKASLEIFDEAQAADVDQIEVGRRVSGRVRFALQVPDLDAALERLAAKGAKLIHPPVETPWGDRNARIEDPDGMQITLYQGTSS